MVPGGSKAKLLSLVNHSTKKINHSSLSRHYEFLLKVQIYSKIIFKQNKYTYTAHQYWEKEYKIFHTCCLYLRLAAIMLLIFCISAFVWHKRMTKIQLVTIHSWNRKKKTFHLLNARILCVIWPAAMMEPQMVWMVELATKPSAEVNAVCLDVNWHRRCLLSRNSWNLQAKVFKYIVFERLQIRSLFCDMIFQARKLR